MVAGDFIAVYILDGNPEKKAAAEYLSERLALPLVVMLDGTMANFEVNREKLGLYPAAENLQVEDWLYYIENCRYLITDSCHGASFAIIHEKPSVCIENEGRGISRFESLGRVFGLRNRFVSDAARIREREDLLLPPDYGRVRGILEQERARCLEWLAEALEREVLPVGEKGNEYLPPGQLLHDLAAGCYRRMKRIYRKLFRDERRA